MSLNGFRLQNRRYQMSLDGFRLQNRSSETASATSATASATSATAVPDGFRLQNNSSETASATSDTSVTLFRPSKQLFSSVSDTNLKGNERQ